MTDVSELILSYDWLVPVGIAVVGIAFFPVYCRMINTRDRLMREAIDAERQARHARWETKAARERALRADPLGRVPTTNKPLYFYARDSWWRRTHDDVSPVRVGPTLGGV